MKSNRASSPSLCREEPDRCLMTSQREGGGLRLSAPMRENGSFGSCETNHVVALGRTGGGGGGVALTLTARAGSSCADS